MNVDEYLNSKLSSSQGKTADYWRDFQNLYSKKLWHLLMEKLKECVKDEQFLKDQGNLVEMHSKFIREFEHRTNPLALTEVIIIMAHNIKEKNEAVQFVESIKNVVKNHSEATVLLLVGMADLKLAIRDKDGRCPVISEIKVLLDEAKLKLNTLNGVTSVHGPFYKCNSMYLREIGDYGAYYTEALRYLGCTDLNALTSEEKSFQAFCLGIAAILGENVYNFGELLAHPILDSLKGTVHYYLVDLLYAFNSGNLKKFEYLRQVWSKQNDLLQNAKLLEQKIRLLALMELAFSRLTRDRRLRFDEIAHATEVKSDRVEHLIMKALSLKLIDGLIDGIDQTLEICWVQPRVLDKKQIGQMSTKFDQWAKESNQISLLVQDQAKEILTQC